MRSGGRGEFRGFALAAIIRCELYMGAGYRKRS